MMRRMERVQSALVHKVHQAGSHEEQELEWSSLWWVAGLESGDV